MCCVHDIFGIPLTVAGFAVAPPALADVIGPARIVGGDRFWIGQTKIHLHGIDAPKMKQTCETSKGNGRRCGELAKQNLERLIRGQEVTCKGDKLDRYKRLVTVCYAGPFNISEQTVVDGWALAYRNYSMDYVRAGWFA